MWLDRTNCGQAEDLQLVTCLGCERVICHPLVCRLGSEVRLEPALDIEVRQSFSHDRTIVFQLLRLPAIVCLFHFGFRTHRDVLCSYDEKTANAMVMTRDQ